MEIPLGFDRALDNTVNEAGIGVTLTGQLADRAQNKLSSDLNSMAGVANVTNEVMTEVRKRQSVALDTATAVAAAKAEEELANSTRDRVIEKADIDKFESSIRGATKGMATPPGYALASDQAMRKVRATMESNIAERNFKMLRDREVTDTATNIQTLTAAGKFDLAQWAIENANNNADLFTADQIKAFKDRLTISQTHSNLIEIIKSGTPDAILAGQDYAMGVLSDTSIDAGLRDSLHASLTALINRVNGDNKLASAEALANFKLAQAQEHSDRMQFAKWGQPNPQTGKTEFMSMEQLDQLKAGGAFLDHPERYNALSNAINQRKVAGASDAIDAAIMQEAVVTDNPVKFTDPNAKASASTTATKYAANELPEFTQFNTWSKPDQASLIAHVNNNYVPDQLGATLASGMTPDSNAFDASIELADTLRTESKGYWLNGVSEKQKLFYNTVLDLRNAGVDVRDAAKQFQALASRTPAEMQQAERDYKTAAGTSTETAVANEEWLRDKLESAGAAALGGEGILGSSLTDALDDDPQMSAYVRGQFNSLVKHFFLQNGGNYEPARQTAFDSLNSVVRPTLVNGYPEYMPYAPEWRPGVNTPFAPQEVHAQWVDAQKQLQGYDETEAQRLASENKGPDSVMFRLTPTTVWKDGYRLFLVVDKDGNAAHMQNGEVALWHPDYAAITEKSSQADKLTRDVQEAQARDYERRIDAVSAELDKNPLYMGNEDYHVVDEAKMRRSRAASYKDPGEPFVNQYPEMFKRAGEWTERTILGTP